MLRHNRDAKFVDEDDLVLSTTFEVVTVLQLLGELTHELFAPSAVN